MSMGWLLVRMVEVKSSIADQRVTRGQRQVSLHHFANQACEIGVWVPTQLRLCFGRVAEKGLDFGGTEIAWIDGDDPLPLLESRAFRGNGDDAMLFRFGADPVNADAEFGRALLHKFANRVLNSSSDNEILGRFLLKHEPLGFDEIAGMPPVPPGIQVAEVQAI